jgi:phosphoribosylamine--glycine ligase
VVEYNCRLGDPETQVVLALHQKSGGDVLSLFRHAASGDIATYKREYESRRKPAGSAAVVVVASKGYPGSYPKGLPITGLQEAQATGATVLHAGTALQDGQLVTAGGRVFGVVGTGDTLRQAIDQAYAGASKIHFEGAFYRKDIGHRAL